jgi:hypothetical protein
MAIVETIGNQFAARVDKLFDKCVLYWPGDLETASGFSILPTGATVTPYGTWSDSTLPNGKTVKQFNGSTNHIDISDNTNWSLGSNPFSIVFWAYMPNVTTSQRIWTQRIDDNNMQDCNLYGNYMGWECYYGGVTQWGLINQIYPNKWVFFALIRDVSSQKIYLNATLSASQGSSSGAVNDGLFTIGGTSEVGYYFEGMIKDFIVFKRALSIADMKYIMDRTSPYRYGAGLNYPLLYKR